MSCEEFINSNFFGALSGALITGLIAIGINLWDSNRRKKEKNALIEKKIELLKIYSDEINRLFKKIDEASKERDSYQDPITDEFDEEGNYRGPIPNEEQWKIHEDMIRPSIEIIRESIIDLDKVLENMNYLDVDILNKKEIIGVYEFKNAYLKNINPLLKHQLNKQIPLITKKDLNMLKEYFDRFQNIISEK